MSSFLVSPEGLSMLADGISDSINTGKIANFPVEDDALNDYFEGKTITEIFEELNYLNAYALECRYGDDINDNTYEDGFTYVPEYTIDAYLKMLDCFIYQCSEGDTEKRLLYRIMCQIQLKISAYVNRSGNPLYEEADWG
jgi:hypothetical protein